MRNGDLPTTYENYPTNELLALWDRIRTEGIQAELQAPKQILIAMKGLILEYGIVSWPVSQPWKLNAPVARRMQRISSVSCKS